MCLLGEEQKSHAERVKCHDNYVSRCSASGCPTVPSMEHPRQRVEWKEIPDTLPSTTHIPRVHATRSYEPCPPSSGRHTLAKSVKQLVRSR